MRKALLLLILLFTAQAVTAQSDTVRIRTSAECGTCRKTLEKEMSFEKGVRKVALDLDTKILTVIYNPSKTDALKIRIAVTRIGYDADSLSAEPKAYERLPDCCRKGGHLH